MASKRDLSTETMVQISGHLLDPKGARTILASLPIVAQLVPVIQEAHDALLTKQAAAAAAPRQTAAKVAAIQEKQGKLDQRHDRKMKGSINLLTALADLTDDPEEARGYLDLRDRLAPDGHKGEIKSYTDEAGAAKLLQSRLDDATKKQLKQIAAPGGKLLDHVTTWIDAALELGVLEVEKDALSKKGAEGYAASDEIAARNQWIRAISALETNLAISGADEATTEKVLGDLWTALEKAERGRVSGKSEPAPAKPEPAKPEEKTGGDV